MPTHSQQRPNAPETPQSAEVLIQPYIETRVDEDRVADLLVARGYQEAVTYSFVDPVIQALFAPGSSGLRLANPISEDLAEMRVSQSSRRTILPAVFSPPSRWSWQASMFHCRT